MFAYRVGKIYSGWNNLKDIKETLLSITETYYESLEMSYTSKKVLKFTLDWKDAQKMAYSLGWNGSLSHPPKVFWLPNEFEFRYAFVFNQDEEDRDNNFVAFVVSPFELPWLERDDVIV